MINAYFLTYSLVLLCMSSATHAMYDDYCPKGLHKTNDNNIEVVDTDYRTIPEAKKYAPHVYDFVITKKDKRRRGNNTNPIQVVAYLQEQTVNGKKTRLK